MREVYVSKEYWHETAEHLFDICRVCATYELLNPTIPDWIYIVIDHYIEILILHICQQRNINLWEHPEYFDMFHDIISDKVFADASPYLKGRQDGPQLACDYANNLYNFLLTVPIKWEKDRYGNWH